MARRSTKRAGGTPPAAPPPIDLGPEPLPAAEETTEAAPAAEPAPIDPGQQSAIIELPVAELGNEYVSRHCEARLNHRQSVALQRLFNGLDAAGARLAGGNRIYSRPDAVRWLLEQIAEAIDGK